MPEYVVFPEIQRVGQEPESMAVTPMTRRQDRTQTTHRQIMAHKTFISYKYSEATDLRDRILRALGSDADYYRGETCESPDLGDLKTATIKKVLADMIYDTSVMIVIVSPNMRQSEWMEWEIRYALTEQKRGDRISRSNGVVCVVQKARQFPGCYSYQWARTRSGWDEQRFFDTINDNRDNVFSGYAHWLPPDYIDIVTEDDFLRDPERYINEAYEKSRLIDAYDIITQYDFRFRRFVRPL